MDCGCTTTFSSVYSFPYEPNTTINYCPLHASADDLRRALEDLIADVYAFGSSEVGQSPNVKTAQYIIDKLQGET